jgi:dipicolinate synthase subunit B
MDKLQVGFALCGSFCTFDRVISVLEKLSENENYNIIPIMSHNAYSIDTRFGKADYFKERIKKATGNEIISTIKDAEPIGPKKLLDILIIAPCTGNTLGKLANGIADTSVTLSAKSHLRNSRPILIAPSTNDAMGVSYKSIGILKNAKNIFMVPMVQDDIVNKPNSLVSDFSLIEESMKMALDGKQIMPLFK